MLELAMAVVALYRQLLYRHCSEPLQHVAVADRTAWVQASETVHIYGVIRGGTQAPGVSTYINQGCIQTRCQWSSQF